MEQKESSSSAVAVSESFPRSIAIAGLGLLGGSLGLALKKNFGAQVEIHGLARRRQSIDEALELGAIDTGAVEAAQVLPTADLTIVCLPVSTTIDFIRDNAGHWSPGAVVTDVGSIKRGIVDAGEELLNPIGVEFIGSHPMAGSEKSGLAAARSDLYKNAVVFTTRTRNTDCKALALVKQIWSGIGAKVHEIGVAEHDSLVAHTSHFLHLIAPAALNVALQPENAAAGTAGAFRDVTRIAAGSTQMWLEIFQQNRDMILKCADEFRGEFDRFVQALAQNDWPTMNGLLEAARAKRLDWECEWSKRRNNQA